MSKLISIQNRRFHLSNERISYVMEVSEEGILEHLFFGSALDANALSAGNRRALRCCTLEYEGVKNLNLSDTGLEYPTFGRSDMRKPALHLVNQDGNTTTDLTYDSHRVIEGKLDLEGLPSSRGTDCETLIITLVDRVCSLRVELYYTIYPQYSLIARSARIINEGETPLTIDAMASASIDFPCADYDVVHLTGSWCREFGVNRVGLNAGTFEINSGSGASGNLHQPFTALAEKGTNETAGQVWAQALMYSGNFSCSLERGEFGAVRMIAGINPFNSNWTLDAKQAFQSPECLLVYSDAGLESMSHTFHDFIDVHIVPPQFSKVPRPTYLNTWEAAYFDINEEKVLALATTAKSLGLEMLVVDDGWFKGRDDDTSSLGDWYSDEEKFPDGIVATAKKVQQLGLKFGLWFEPEMVNEDSDLFREHPDWILHVPHRKPSTGRYQLTLDLSRKEVVDYLFERLDSFLSSAAIDYVKWDMNRTMSEVGSAALGPQRQQEVAHRYMLGLYDLVERLTSRYPNVLFENCASGGNRFDLGMLRYMSQGWVSDMSEPIGRLPIVTGASHLYPPSVMASYIGPTPSHQNHRITSLRTRFQVGFFCAARGLSLNSEDLGAQHEELASCVSDYIDSSEDMVAGRFRRLMSGENEYCWQVTSPDGSVVYLGYFHVLSGANLPYRRVRLRGLDHSAHYKRRDTGELIAASSLMSMGMDLPYVHVAQFGENEEYMPMGDFSSWLCVFERVAQT